MHSFCPSLHTATTLDNEVKSALVTDMFNIAGFRLPPEYRSNNTQLMPCHSDTPTSSTNTSEIVCDSITPHGSKGTFPDGRTVPPSVRENGLRGLHYSGAPYSSMGRKSHIPILNGGKSSVRTIRNTAVRSRVILSRNSVTNPNKPIVSMRNVFTRFLPVSDPRLWDVALTWDERQKHTYHSRLFCREESVSSSIRFDENNFDGSVTYHLFKLCNLYIPIVLKYCFEINAG
ncbi:unnamed protein product [Echinostoma caproni]|uniref:Uncharacterized protein n=1 Tax=Echinostoma caproni TaxID=27848 RepID=A0A183BD57_9TREM|nr:unnamed protein product [Echinostoma caproni]